MLRPASVCWFCCKRSFKQYLAEPKASLSEPIKNTTLCTSPGRVLLRNGCLGGQWDKAQPAPGAGTGTLAQGLG